MKKRFKLIIPVLLVVLLIGNLVYASSLGMFQIQTEEGVTAEPQTADKTSIQADTVVIDNVTISDYYADAQRLSITYSESVEEGAYYLITVLKGTAKTPTTENIVYIDQITATGTTIQFDVYPISLENGEEYHIYLSGTAENLDGLTEIASFRYGKDTNTNVKGVTVDPAKAEILIGDSVDLKAVIDPADATNQNVSWASNAEKIATVNEQGKVTAVSVGNAIITVTTEDGGFTGTCEVTVLPIKVTGVSLNLDKTTLTVGEKTQLYAEITPNNATDQDVVWSSSDSSVATVDDNGLVTAVQAGNADIVVTTKDGGYTATCAVTVNPIAVSGISLDISTATLIIGNTMTIKAVVTPENAADKTVYWTSSDEGVVNVDEYGFVSAVGVGTATITATTKDGGFKATCEIIVDPIAVTGIHLDTASANIKIGNQIQLLATVVPENATNQNIVWTSNNPDVASVDEFGVIMAKDIGVATITVTTEDGGFTADCVITVEPIEATGIKMEVNSATITIGGVMTLNAEVLPENATNRTVLWSTSNPEIVSVDENGQITANGVGVAVITASTEDGVFTASCEVTVEPIPVEGVSLDKLKAEIENESTLQLTATVINEDATNKNVIWSSSDESVATVDETGLVQAWSEGTAIITVTTEDGGFTSSCEITVLPIKVTGVTLNITAQTLLSGSNICLLATITPEKAANQNVVWSSSDERVATVDENGIVTAGKAGIAVITVTTEDGGYTASCEITVEEIGVESITLDVTSAVLTPGAVLTLNATVSPDNATNKNVIWVSSDEAVVQVSEDGVVTPFLPGQATVTVKSVDNPEITATCEITVNSVEVESLMLNPSTTELATNSSLLLEAVISPQNATDQTLTWTSSDPSVVDVDSSGMVTALKYGKATITATTANGLTATCQIQTRFYDVNDPGRAYYKAVYWAVDKGITKCKVNFNPDGGVTRGEFVAFLYRLSGSPKVTKFATKFSDVNSKTKFYKEINWAVNKGIIKGFSDKTFRPNDGVTRGQAAIMLWRYAGRPSVSTTKSPFTDVKAANTDTCKAIVWGNKNGIIKGYSDKTFRAGESCTRGNVVTFLYRYKQKF